ncbi:MAG: thiamine-phosphate kinase [Rhodoluna sp.]|nr:thiamine-phosphate kinase [Rhodoluna sp.]MBP6186265.1 thiamine-phosphate kinase [Rhodoluna sp.]
MPTIAELGENESLKRTIARLNLSASALVGPGDDSAVVSAPDARFTVTTDTMVEGHDFKLEWSTGYDLGYKAIASNVADVAAMGAKPTALVVALICRPSTEIEWLESFADGLRDGCLALAPEAAVVGGDLTIADTTVIAVTAHGDLEGRAPVLRSGAQVGDVVAVAGTLGKAAAGLSLLFSGNADAISAYDEFVNFQRRPQPPIAAGVLAATAGATSMLDLSDGLSRDAARIAKASNVTVSLNRRDLQGFEAMLEEAARAIGANAFDWVLDGGEDHSLLATFAAGSTIPREFKPIGEIIKRTNHDVLLDMAPVAEGGWDSVRD